MVIEIGWKLALTLIISTIGSAIIIGASRVAMVQAARLKDGKPWPPREDVQ